MALSKNQIKYLRSLKQKKFRQMYNNFVVEGTKMAEELLSQPSFSIEGVFGLQAWVDEQQMMLKKYQSVVHVVSERDLGQISNLKTPNQVLIVAKQKEREIALEKVGKNLSLYLDGIQDPGNLGTILRIADWFKIPYIFLSPDSVEPYNPKVVQASMGAFLRVSTSTILELASLKKQLPDTPIYGAMMSGANVYQLGQPDRGIIVIGNEGKGIRPEVVTQLTKPITIPSHGGAESLNAAVATGIICACFRNNLPQIL